MTNIVNYSVKLQSILQTFYGIWRYLTVNGNKGKYGKLFENPCVYGFLKLVKVR